MITPVVVSLFKDVTIWKKTEKKYTGFFCGILHSVICYISTVEAYEFIMIAKQKAFKNIFNFQKLKKNSLRDV
jgi:hypothetical protein